MNKIPVGLSSCLLGFKVRHDGGHRQNQLIINQLSEFFSFHPFCPEVAAGLGTPRPAFRLKLDNKAVRMVDSKNGQQDVTDTMIETSQLAAQRMDNLSGYILKKDSPSCGMERVRVYNEKGYPNRKGQGVFALELMRSCPNLPVEEEGRLMDPVLRENFIQRIFVYNRWQSIVNEGMTVSGLQLFHRQHKLMLLAHDEVAYRDLGQLAAKVTLENLTEFCSIYISSVMNVLAKQATRKRHTNVLMHLAGYFKNTLSVDEKAEMHELLERYRQGLIPLVVPITMLKHFQRRRQHPYLKSQYYLDPYPEDLMLRNHV